MVINTEPYEAALSNAAYFQQAQAGYLRVGGRDRIDFLQRQSTNDLRLLSADRSVSTVLTSPTARILDLFCVIDEGDSLGVITQPGRFSQSLKFLRSRIFFSDQVTVDDISQDFAEILLCGPQAEGIIGNLGMKPPALDHQIKYEIDGRFAAVIGQKILANQGYRILVPASCMDEIKGRLDEAGACSLDSETFEILRVEAGQPGPTGELVDGYTPLEVGLGDLISDTKGCYTGQEIIARQISYDKVTKSLVGVKFNKLVDVGAEIKVDGKSAGILTSAAQSTRFGAIGLAVVRRQYRDVGKKLSVIDVDGSATSGETAALPFR